MDSEKRGSKLFLGRKLWPYLYKPDHKPPPTVGDDIIYIFDEQTHVDTYFGCSVLWIMDDAGLLITEGLVEVGP